MSLFVAVKSIWCHKRDMKSLAKTKYTNHRRRIKDCTARDCCLIRQNFTVCSIIKLATIAFDETSSYWPAQKKTPNFSAFHWSPHGCLITIGQHFVTTRVVHLPKRTETPLITESDQNRANH